MSAIRSTKLILIALLILAVASVANAQATRTWVSGVGDDVNPCSRTAPCKTWAGAISKTADGGEISALDPGGFGAVTITKGITLNGDGTLASILAAGTSGIIINAANTKDIIIRNLSINGALGTASPGTNGIRFLAGRSLVIQNVNIYGFATTGIDINGPAAVTQIVDSNIVNITGTAIQVQTTAVGARASVQMINSRIMRCGTGINAVRQGNIMLENSSITNCATGISVNNAGANPASEANVHHGSISMNATGVLIGVGTTGRFDDVMFAANGTALTNNGTCQSRNNNTLAGNVNPNGGAACAAATTF